MINRLYDLLRYIPTVELTMKIMNDLEQCRAELNREYLVRVIMSDGHVRLVGFTTLVLLIGELHAVHFSKKVIKAYRSVHSFNFPSKSLRVTFVRRS